MRRPNIRRGRALSYPAAVSARYSANLDKAVLRMTRSVRSEIEGLFEEDFAEEHFAQDKSISAQARILTNKTIDKFNDYFAKFGQKQAESFAEQVNKASGASSRMSLKDLGAELTLSAGNVITGEVKEALSAVVAENTALIKSISQQYLTQVQAATMRSITTGRGLADLIPFLEKQGGITRRRATAIATDQVRKSFGALNVIRMKDAGVREFEWVHSRGGHHPRKYHKDVLSGKVFNMADPPVIDEVTGERGFPGQLINCRCRMVPCVSFGKKDRQAG